MSEDLESVFCAEEIEFLSSPVLGRLATVQKSGVVQNNPVGFTLVGDEIRIGGYNLTRSQKFLNASRGGWGSLVVDEIVTRSPWHVRGVEIRGRLSVDEDGGGAIIISPARIFRWGLIPAEKGIQRRTVVGSD